MWYELFSSQLCPRCLGIKLRCFATDDRNLMKHEDFDAILFHQRSLDFTDIPDPKKRKASQRYIHYIMESAQYLYMDISTMNNFFNWTMTYRRDSDFFRPYGRIVQVSKTTSWPGSAAVPLLKQVHHTAVETGGSSFLLVR